MKKIITLTLLLFLVKISSAQFTNAVIDSLTQNTLRDEVVSHCMAIDNLGNLHVIYQRENPVAGWDIYYKMRDINGIWSAESLVNDQPGYNPSLAVNANTGFPIVAYVSTDSIAQIKVAERNGTGWNTLSVTNSSRPNYAPNVTMDSVGNYMLVFIGEDSTVTGPVYKIFYSQYGWATGNWITEMLTGSQLGPFGTGANPSVVIDRYNAVHIVYRGGNFNSYKINYAFDTIPGNGNWNYSILNTPNAEDFTAFIKTSTDLNGISYQHVLISGNDGFGFPSKAYYMKKAYPYIAFDSAIAVAPGFSGNAADLFVDNANVPHVVMDEISGNIYTGNVIYADSTDWNGYLALQSNDIYNSNLVMDYNGNGYILAHRGNTYPEEEAIVYGYQPALNSVSSPFVPSWSIWQSQERIHLRFNQHYNGMLELSDLSGRIVYSTKMRAEAGEDITLSSEGFSAGTYLLRAGNLSGKILLKK